jgi:cell wall-associated NlpC family hydrolase
MADPDAASATAPSRAVQVIAAAQRFAAEDRGKPYVLGGKTRAGYDCSYFVYLALHEVFPDYEYLSTGAIASSPLFEEVTEPRPGDLIYFPPGQNPYQVQHHADERVYPGHVGIVVDGATWIGRQPNQVGPVPMSQIWWASRTHRFFRYRGLKAADHAFLINRSRSAAFA